jgi:hypothetical protein
MKKLDGPLDVAFINRTFFSDYKDVKIINEGECFLWAYHAYRLYKDVELWDMETHAFVRSKSTGKFYDSEKPEGEKDWKDLRATNFGVGCGCLSCRRPPRHFITGGSFRRGWGYMAKKFDVKWNKVHAKIKRVIEKET